MKKVFVLISDKTYLEHAKSLFMSAKIDGKWDGDFCLIANGVQDSELVDFKKFGVDILHRKIDNYYYANYFIFDNYMKKWDFLMYMDCDFTIFDSLNSIINDNEMNEEYLFVDEEPFQIHQYFCQGWPEDKKNNSLNILKENYDLNKKGFNAGFMCYNTSLIKDFTLDDLLSLSSQLQPINNHTHPNGSDQPILNLYFINQISFIKDRKISFWKNSNINTVAQHHCRWEAPWSNNSYSDRLKTTYVNNYNKNLRQFYEYVKRQTV